MAVSGTGGHIYPAVSIAQKFLDNKFTPFFFISSNNISTKILKNYSFDYFTFNMSGFSAKNPFVFSKFLSQFVFCFFKSLFLIMKIRPAAAIGTGGYISVPVLFAAKILGVKIFIHEQNGVMGKANFILNAISCRTFLSFNSPAKLSKNDKTLIYGYPIREDFLTAKNANALKNLKLSGKSFKLLIFGGSLGAVKINEFVCKTFLPYCRKGELEILHITGEKDYLNIKEKTKEEKNYKVFKYMHNIAGAYSACSIIICRSGAGTIFEIQYMQKKAILIPYPFAAQNHQYINAKLVEKEGEIAVLEEREMTQESLLKLFFKLKNSNIEPETAAAFELPQVKIYKEIIKCLTY
jgi:UDP-N-acetylglucosamine--N-acetylmuramyl-(pentapeptide) pyrophosphoryl-undecaprenol N-acetylglucosamine transferase